MIIQHLKIQDRPLQSYEIHDSQGHAYSNWWKVSWVTKGGIEMKTRRINGEQSALAIHRSVELDYFEACRVPKSEAYSR